MRVTIVGAGVGGLAVAGHAGLMGLEVAVHDINDDPLAAIRKRGGIEVRGIEEGFAPVSRATTDIEAAAAGADLVVVVTQGPDQRAAAQALTPHLRPGMVLLLKPGGTFGAVEVGSVLDRAGCEGVSIAETDSFVFGCSVPEPAVSKITGAKSRTGVAVLPPGSPEKVLAVVKALFGQTVLVESVLHTGLANMNAILHLSTMMLNVGRIEGGPQFDFYGEGVTQSVARVMEATDRERVAVAASLGVLTPTLMEWIGTSYGVDEGGLYPTVQKLHRDVYGPSPAPTTHSHRYLTEDVPCGAVPLADLGRMLGVDTPVTTACIVMADLVTGRDWAHNGRTMERIGLAGLTAGEIRTRFLV